MKTIKLSVSERSEITKQVNASVKSISTSAKNEIKEQSKSISWVRKQILNAATDESNTKELMQFFAQSLGLSDINDILATDLLTVCKGFKPMDENNGIYHNDVLDKDGNSRKAFTVTEIINGITKLYKAHVKTVALSMELEKKTKSEQK